MKVSCPNCQRVLRVPDEWAGRTVKCPSCKTGVSVPALTPSYEDINVNFDSLGSIESEGEALVFEKKAKPMSLKEAQAASGTKTAPINIDPKIRSCPKCGQKVRSEDLFVDLICRHCGGPIPGRELREEDKGRYTSDMAGRMQTQTSFYTGFSGAAVYPLPGAAAILLGMAVALLAIAVPLLGILAFTSSASLNEINKVSESDNSWVGVFLTVAFAIEGIYFGSVAYYILIDTIRTTTSGSETPPNLTWNIFNLGATLAGYAALIAFYAIVVMALSGGMPSAEALSNPYKLLLLALLTFSVPMSIIGLAGGHSMDGLNPIRVFRSIGRLLGHYIFLFLIVLLYGGIYVGLTWLLMGWAGPVIAQAAKKGVSGGFVNMLIGIAAWSLLVGLGFYFAYSIGRVLGLFSRSYREQFDFED